MAQPMRVQRSYVAAVVGLPKRGASFGESALRVGAIAAGLIPVVGALAYFGFDWLANRTKTANEKAAITEWYRPQIARQLGIDPNRVTTKDLELAATVNPTLARVVDTIHKQERSATAISALSAAGGAAASAIIPIPGTGLLAHGVGKMAASTAIGVAGTTAGSAVGGWLTSPDVLKNPQEVLERIVAQRDAGNPITPVETFMLRVAQKSELQQAIKEKTGREYYNLSPEQHMAVMHQFPRIAAMAEKDAEFMARGGDPRELSFILPEAHWQTRVKQEAARAQAQQPVRA